MTPRFKENPTNVNMQQGNIRHVHQMNPRCRLALNQGFVYQFPV